MADLSVAPTARGTLAWAGLLRVSLWLQLFGAFLTFVLLSLFAATHSDLAKFISPGESPFFQWIRIHMAEFLWFGFGYLLLACGLQYLRIRRSHDDYPHWMTALVGVELIALITLASALLYRWDGLIPWGHALLQVSILLQVFMGLWRSNESAPSESIQILDLKEGSFFLFLSSLFLFAAVPASLDPSWQRGQEFVHLDSSFEVILSRILPPILSGSTGLWFGIGMLVILIPLRALWIRLHGHDRIRRFISFLPFLFVSGLYGGISLASLAYGIEWELSSLRLRSTLLPLFIFLCGGGGALSYIAFRRLALHAPRAREQSLIGMMALSMGAVLLFPVTRLVTRQGCDRRSWQFLLFSSFLGSLLLGYYTVYGDLFNPWFTVFSYLKGSILKIAAVMAAGILVLIVEELRSVDTVHTVKTTKEWMAVALIVLLGFLPFVSLERYREIKAGLLQFNEYSMVDATYARALSDAIGLRKWVRLGQVPKRTTHQDPWPLPWTLKKAGRSLLPNDFNLVVIVVDALRGDAFHSAGYHRNLTPFLDKWASEEAISFRRAYSQGGGTFAAFPFLVAGRSRFTLYGPNLYQENLYFKIAQAEGIHNVMVVKEFGPRAIFPPDFPVIELGRTGAGLDGTSVPADEVFAWAQDAIAQLAKGERFLAFLHLMDVHNDLWKKADGLDFGDNPRELYDNNLSYVDRAFSRFVGWLQQRRIYHRTLILLTADHGEQFWEHGASLHGHTVYEEEIRIPLILLTHAIRGRVEDVPVIAADMAPTIAELAGYAVYPPYTDPYMGVSLVPLLLHKDRSRYLHRDIVGRASFKQRYFLYRNWEWKLVYFAEFDLLQLFNTVQDPGERTNMLQEKPELAAELERTLFRYLERVAGMWYEPLLDDPASTPETHRARSGGLHRSHDPR